MLFKKKYFVSIILLFCLVFFLSAERVFAFTLNVDYPRLLNGTTITAGSTVPEYLKYVFDVGIFIGFLAAFLSLVWAGVLWLFSPVSATALAKARDRVSASISGILILAVLYLIITTINPSLSFFYLSPLKPIQQTPPTATPPQSGVYLYKNSSCSDQPDLIKASSMYDLKGLNSVIQSAKIVHDYQGDKYYISILYESFGFWGKCFYVDPNISCNQNITPPFATSVAVYQYDRYPSTGSITFYHEPFYKSNGGSFKVYAAQATGIYIKALQDLNYMINPNGNPNDPDNCTVPKDKMDCVLWDGRGACLKRKCPDLAGDNIGSIKIDGNFVVLLVYFDPADAPKGPWTLCQSFPAQDDRIKMGPNKVKWENIENQNRKPNYVLIFPVIDNTNPDANK